MSNPSSTAVCFSTFRSIFDAASKEYKKTTGHDLQSHPFATELGHCDSPDAILQIYQNQANALDQTGKSNQTLMKWLDPTVNLLCMFVATLGEGVALVSLSEVVFLLLPIDILFQPFPPGKAIFTGIGVLLGVNFSPRFIVDYFL